ncbi:Outer membrane protein assembly factor BamA [Buchnera aphidicola (Neophyllaphis podocarpi)]|uniref:outer membrane protein assembly factor BamA n=1 Tax=Buchnera aphidicola TaxID=9 RepID=UPI00346416E8
MIIKLIFLVLFFLIFCVYSYGFTYYKIIFKGLNLASSEKIYRIITNNQINKISNVNIKKSIFKLFNTSYFEKIDVFVDKNKIFFNFKEHPIIDDIHYIDNRYVNSKYINNIANNLGINVNFFLNPRVLFLFKKKLEDLYKRLGSYNTVVKIFYSYKSTNHIILKIVFFEKKLLSFDKIFFSKKNIVQLNKNFSYCNLKNSLDFLSIFDRFYCKFNPSSFINYLNLLQSYFFNHGYINFNLNYIKSNYIESRNKISILLDLKQGKRFRISKFFLHIYPDIFYDYISNIILINSGEVFNYKKILCINKKIAEFLKNNGYINYSLDLYPIINYKDKTVELHFNIITNNRYLVNNIYYVNNNYIKNQTLNLILSQKQKKWYRENLIISDKNHLLSSEYFDNLDIKIKKSPNSLNKIDLFFYFKEKNNNLLNFGVSYGSSSNVSLNLNLIKKKIFKTEHILNINNIKNINESNGEISIFNPYLFKYLKSIKSIFFYKHKNNDPLKLPDYFNNTYGSNFIFEIFNKKKHSFFLNLEYLHDFNSKNFSQFFIWNDFNLYNNFINTTKYHNYSFDSFFIKFLWNFNNFDNLIFPKIGSSIFFKSKFVIPLYNTCYFKSVLEIKNYIPFNINKNFILFNNIKLGFGNSLYNSHYPFNESFYLKTSNSVRNLNYNSIFYKLHSTHDYYLKYSEYNNNFLNKFNNITGGNTFFLTNSEMIFPVPFLNNSYIDNLRMSIFLDLGNIWNVNLLNTLKYFSKSITANKYQNIYNLHVTTGISVKFLSPIGIMTFSFGYPLYKQTGDSIEFFKLNLEK